MADLFSTSTLQAVVQNLKVPQSGFLDAYFKQIMEEDTEEIHFDVDNNPRRIAPYVSPLLPGKVVQSRGYQTKTFKPAYVKDKRVFTPNNALKRAMGERVGGGDMSPEQRQQIKLAQELSDQMDMLTRRFELQACSALYSGSITVASPEYPTTVVNFGRDANHTKVLTGGNQWGDAGVKPLDLLQDWADQVVKTEGVFPTDVNMTIDAWKIFRNDADVSKRLETFRGSSTMQRDAHKGEGRIYQGNVDGFDIYTYSGWYVDPATGTETAMLPAYTVIMTSPALEGVRQFGAILDHDNLKASAYFPKSWLEQDPSTRYLLMQSAPLMVPYRINASLRATVK